MSPTVRIAQDDRDRLRRLQLGWRELTGKHLSQQELLGILIRHGVAHLGHLLDATARPADAGAMAPLRAAQGDHGDLSSGIDQSLYGGDDF